MKNRQLFYRMMASFSLLIIIGAVILILNMRDVTENRYRRLVEEGDRREALRLAPLIEETYRSEGSWKAVEELLSIRPGRGSMMRGNRGGHMMQMHMAPQYIIDARILLIDKDRHIVFDSHPMGSPPIEPTELQGGIALDRSGSSLGRIYIGSMIQAGLSEEGDRFLRELNRSLLFSLLVVFLIAIILIGLLSYQISAPIHALARLSDEIAEGKLYVRSREDARGEIGILQSRFNLMVQRLEEDQEAKQQMIADAAHDLRTPITLIRGKLEMMLDGVYEIKHDRIQELYEESAILEDLVADLRTLAQAEGNSSDFSTSSLSPHALAVEALGLFQARADQEGIQVENRVDNHAPEIQGNRKQLLQLFSNILANALRHSPRGGKIEIFAGRGEQAQLLYFDIENSGSSLPPGTERKIFERFYRVDEHRNRKDGGQGLGLAICKAIVEQHGGSICAENIRFRGESGVRIRFSLPISAPSGL